MYIVVISKIPKRTLTIPSNSPKLWIQHTNDYITLHGKRDIADAIKLLIIDWITLKTHSNHLNPWKEKFSPVGSRKESWIENLRIQHTIAIFEGGWATYKHLRVASRNWEQSSSPQENEDVVLTTTRKLMNFAKNPNKLRNRFFPRASSQDANSANILISVLWDPEQRAQKYCVWISDLLNCELTNGSSFKLSHISLLNSNIKLIKWPTQKS